MLILVLLLVLLLTPTLLYLHRAHLAAAAVAVAVAAAAAAPAAAAAASAAGPGAVPTSLRWGASLQTQNNCSPYIIHACHTIYHVRMHRSLHFLFTAYSKSNPHAWM
jgi:uncharacterized membrane protein